MRWCRPHRRQDPEEIDELTHMLKAISKGGAARQARRFDRQEHAAAFARGIGEHRPADINAIIEEEPQLAYHGARAKNPASNITAQARARSGCRHDRSYPQEITGVPQLISNGFYAASKRKETGEDGFDPR